LNEAEPGPLTPHMSPPGSVTAVYWTPTAWLSSAAVTRVQASTALPDDPPDTADAVTAAADAVPPAAAAPEAVAEEPPEQAVRLSRHRPAPAATSGMYWRIDKVVMHILKQPTVMAE
jgi:hypothetical protein